MSQLIFFRHTGIAQLPTGRDTYGSTRRRSIATLNSSRGHELLDFDGLLLQCLFLHHASQTGAAWLEAKSRVLSFGAGKGVYRWCSARCMNMVEGHARISYPGCKFPIVARLSCSGHVGFSGSCIWHVVKGESIFVYRQCYCSCLVLGVSVGCV